MSIETAEYAAMLKRMIRAYGRRVADGDDVDLREMLAVQAELENAIRVAVQGQREIHGQSWAYIAGGLGVTRQSAFERFGRKVS